MSSATPVSCRISCRALGGTLRSTIQACDKANKTSRENSIGLTYETYFSPLRIVFLVY
jgi:hypothetical protein